MPDESNPWEDSPLPTPPSFPPPSASQQPVSQQPASPPVVPLPPRQQPFSGQGAYPAWPQPAPQQWSGPQFAYSPTQPAWTPPAQPQQPAWTPPAQPQQPAWTPPVQPPQPVWAPPDQPAWTPPSQPAWTPPVPPRKKRNRKRTLLRWLIAVSILVVLALVASLGVYIHRLGWEHTDYGYDIVERATVDATQPWVINLPIVITPASSSIQIYTDPELTHAVDFAAFHDDLTITGRKRTLTPSTTEVVPASNLPQGDMLTLGGDSWPAGAYYIVERYDFFGGSLERPRVHVYTVQADPGSFTSPDFTMEVADGVPTFTWSGIDGVSSYYILKSTPDGAGDERLEVIGWADGDVTSWSAVTQDTDYENARQNQEDITSYNTGFSGLDSSSIDTLCTPQDSQYQGMTPPDWDDSLVDFPSFAVVATMDENSTLPQFQDGRDVIIDTPVAEASATLDQMATDAGTDLFLPDTFPVTMGDCRTMFFPVTPQSLVADSDETSITLTYGIDGTRLTHSVTGSGDSYSTVQNLGSGLRTLIQFGPMQDLNYMTSDQVRLFAMSQTPSADTPETPYSWNGTSDMVKFIAANMYAGNPAIDLSAFTADPSNPLIADAANEAYFQNPYITDFSPIVGVQNDVLYISYEMTAEDRAAAASRVKDKADQILASIVNDSMSDRDKASAINTYLAKNAVYDDDAANFNDGRHSRDEYVERFPNSWDAEGVLIDGKGVCSSYAAAYKLLADEAGLNSVTVTGWADTSGIGHEWVKVNIDGSWWVVDPTWDSNVWEQIRGNVQMFFMLTDDQADRTPFNGFVVDSHIGDYDTP